jgi:Tfp pilus assembly protein PilF
MAQIVMSNGDIKNAKIYASKALAIDNNNLWYLMMLSGLYYQEKNIDSAIIYYERAVNYFPEKENLQLTLANLYSENKNYQKANSIYDAFDKKYGVNDKSTVSAVKNYMTEGKFSEALLKIKVLLSQNPDEILYNGLLAEIYSGQGENEKAMEVYNKLLERNPDDPQIQLSLCDFLITTKNYNELFLLLNSVVLNNNISKEEKVSLMARLIDLHDINNNIRDKIMINIMVLEANYTNDQIIPLLRPELLIKENKLSEAAIRLEEIIKQNPENYYPWEKLLFIYLQLGDYKNLMIRGEECATRFNRSFPAKLLYANGAMENEKYQIAIDELKKAEILAGENKEYLIQVLTMKADVYYRMKDYTKAFATFEEALESDREDLTVINNYAYYLAEQDVNLKEAEMMAKKVIDTEKGNTTFLDTYGWVLYKRGKLNEASRIMEEIIKKGEKPDAVWFEHYGFILKKQKKCKEAIENWNIALKLDDTKNYLINEIKNCTK